MTSLLLLLLVRCSLFRVDGVAGVDPGVDLGVCPGVPGGAGCVGG